MASSTKPKGRADLLVVQARLVPSRQKAQALILAGKVFAGDHRIEKAGELLPVDSEFRIKGTDHPYVSRGGVKLQGALKAFQFDVKDAVVADFGASTGGFTDCLLQNQARRVYAVDVGYGQLHEKLRRDERVVVMERTNARYLAPGDLPEPVDLVVIDTSFIGLNKLLPSAISLLCEKGNILALIKPQFEVGRRSVGKGGVVRNAGARQEAIERIEKEATLQGLTVVARADAVIKGPRGNQEHFIWLKK